MRNTMSVLRKLLSGILAQEHAQAVVLSVTFYGFWSYWGWFGELILMDLGVIFEGCF